MEFHLTFTGFEYVYRGPRDHGQWTLRAYHASQLPEPY